MGGGEGWLEFPALLSDQKTLMELVFNICCKFRWSLDDSVSQIHSPHHVGAHGIFSDLLRSVQVLKREWGAQSYEKLQRLFIPSKPATLVPAFAVKDLQWKAVLATTHYFLIDKIMPGRGGKWMIWKLPCGAMPMPADPFFAVAPSLHYFWIHFANTKLDHGPQNGEQSFSTQSAIDDVR